jgi:hypothetical protein
MSELVYFFSIFNLGFENVVWKWKIEDDNWDFVDDTTKKDLKEENFNQFDFLLDNISRLFGNL